MLYHQKSLAQVKAGSRRRAASQIFWPATSRWDWRQSHTSERSRKYQPLATQPWSRGRRPVVNVDCTEHVTAGRIVRSGRIAPRRASAARLGVASPRRSGVSPTTLRTSVRRIAGALTADHGGLSAQDRVALEQPRLIDLGPGLDAGDVELAGLAEERDRVAPHDRLDVGVRDPALPHERRRLG